MPFDQHFFRSQYIMFHFSEFLRLGGQQLDLEIHGFRPVAKNEQAHLRAGLVSILNMIPDPVERLVGLAHVKDRAFISNNVQIQLFPGSRALLQQDELFHRDGDTAGYAVMFCIHMICREFCLLTEYRNTREAILTALPIFRTGDLLQLFILREPGSRPHRGDRDKYTLRA